MHLTAPLVFEPLYMERVWGGRNLEALFHKKLPAGVRVGESWELVDRPEAQSVVHTGPLRGKTLSELWSDYREAIFGPRYANFGDRFPLLIKLLDAEERLSVQVHPPATVAAELGGEPKTEMWYILAASEGADIFAGLKNGVTRPQFEAALAAGNCESTLHRIPTKAGDCIFIPSGRLHAIGAGNVIVEVQQNSDTTYRVFDWNRTGLDGKPRALHVKESLRSIDFNDHEPQLQGQEVKSSGVKSQNEQSSNAQPLVQCADFRVEHWNLDAPVALPAGDFAVVTCLSGAVQCSGETYPPGHFFLVPANLQNRTLTPAKPNTTLLVTTVG